jgi:hypothetical protein
MKLFHLGTGVFVLSVYLELSLQFFWGKFEMKGSVDDQGRVNEHSEKTRAPHTHEPRNAP